MFVGGLADFGIQFIQLQVVNDAIAEIQVMQQGGVVFGKTDPSAEVRFEGRQVRVSEEGRFVFGFGRDFAESARVEVRYPDGAVETRELTVAAREYQIQRIDGLPPSR